MDSCLNRPHNPAQTTTGAPEAMPTETRFCCCNRTLSWHLETRFYLWISILLRPSFSNIYFIFNSIAMDSLPLYAILFIISQLKDSRHFIMYFFLTDKNFWFDFPSIYFITQFWSNCLGNKAICAHHTFRLKRTAAGRRSIHHRYLNFNICTFSWVITLYSFVP